MSLRLAGLKKFRNTNPASLSSPSLSQSRVREEILVREKNSNLKTIERQDSNFSLSRPDQDQAKIKNFQVSIGLDRKIFERKKHREGRNQIFQPSIERKSNFSGLEREKIKFFDHRSGWRELFSRFESIRDQKINFRKHVTVKTREKKACEMIEGRDDMSTRDIISVRCLAEKTLEHEMSRLRESLVRSIGRPIVSAERVSGESETSREITIRNPRDLVRDHDQRSERPALTFDLSGLNFGLNFRSLGP